MALTFVLSALAVYRLARAIALEEGPFSCFTMLRGSVDPDQRSWIGRGINCPLCLGVWLAVPIGIWQHSVLWWLAVAGASAWLQLQEK